MQILIHISIIFVNYYSQDSAFGYIGSNKMSEGQTGTGAGLIQAYYYKLMHAAHLAGQLFIRIKEPR